MRSTVAAILVALHTVAAFRPDHGPRDFGKIDGDGDGLLSPAEMETHVDERFQAEIEGFMSFFDADGDASVTKAEYEARASEFFVTDARTPGWFWQSLFGNHEAASDGAITAESLQSKKSLVLTATAQEKSRQWLREHDQDGDKSITQSEYGGSADMWKLLDPDGDGATNARDYLTIGGQFGKPHLVIDTHDVDKDGQLSAVEFANMHHEL